MKKMCRTHSLIITFQKKKIRIILSNNSSCKGHMSKKQCYVQGHSQKKLLTEAMSMEDL